MNHSTFVEQLRARHILIRGAGDLATGIAHRLYGSGLRPAMTEVSMPLAVRRTVSFCEAVYDGACEVEGIRAERVDHAAEIDAVRNRGVIPILVDPDLECLRQWPAHVLVDATLAKKNLGLTPSLAPLVIGVGPGFTAGIDVHRVIESNRGHDLGRIYCSGTAEPNTGIPGNTQGYTVERVLRAPREGTFATPISIGEAVTQGQVIGLVDGIEVQAGISGVVRGLLRSGTAVSKGLKIGDIDPRTERDYCFTISEKARALGGAVLELVIASMAEKT